MQKWQKNLYSIWVAELFAVIAFQCFYPFVPYYIRELGISKVNEIAFWSGVIVASSGFSLALFSPIWGYLGDKYGRKLMLLRAMFGAALCVFLIAFSKNVYQLLIFRMLQGVFSGTVAASIPLVSTTVPQNKLGFSLGFLQTTLFIGSSLGPLVGGLIADKYSYKAAIIFASGLLFIGGLIVIFLVKEKFQPLLNNDGDEEKKTFSLKDLYTGFKILKSSKYLLTTVFLLFFVQYSHMAIVPIFPLYVQILSKEIHHLASTTGFIIAITGVTGSISAVILGRLSDTFDSKKIIIIAILGAGIIYFFQSLVGDVRQLFITRILLGFFIGGIEPMANALIGKMVSKDHRGKIYGISSSARYFGNIGGAFSGGILASFLGIKFVIFLISILFILMGFWIFMISKKNNKII